MIARQLIEQAIPDLDDVAMTFIEQEVGRRDWRRNWTQMRACQDMATHAKVWLDRCKLGIDPHELVRKIDQFVETERGSWITY